MSNANTGPTVRSKKLSEDEILTIARALTERVHDPLVAAAEKARDEAFASMLRAAVPEPLRRRLKNIPSEFLATSTSMHVFSEDDAGQRSVAWVPSYGDREWMFDASPLPHRTLPSQVIVSGAKALARYTAFREALNSLKAANDARKSFTKDVRNTLRSLGRSTVAVEALPEAADIIEKVVGMKGYELVAPDAVRKLRGTLRDAGLQAA